MKLTEYTKRKIVESIEKSFENSHIVVKVISISSAVVQLEVDIVDESNNTLFSFPSSYLTKGDELHVTGAYIKASDLVREIEITV